MERPLSDTLTVLSSSTDHQLVKTFSGQEHLRAQWFKPGTFFNVEDRPISDLGTLAKELKGLETDSIKTIIRGTRYGPDAACIARSKDNFAPKPRKWCMIDIDSLPWDGDLEDQKAMIAYASSQLPAEFRSVDCWYHFSSSMGIQSGIRVHLWYWLERPCSDDEMKAWLSGCPVDLRLFDPVQIHLTANPHFIDGAVDPYPNRSGLYEAGNGVTTVSVPDDLEARAKEQLKAAAPRTRNNLGVLDPAEIVRDPDTGLATDGREQLMFRLSNEVMLTLVSPKHTPNEDEVTEALWTRFGEEADLSVVSDRGLWTIDDARVKAKARLQELEDGTYSFVSKSDRTTLVAGSISKDRPHLVSPTKAQEKLSMILADFFDELGAGKIPRSGIRLTMGTGKTRQTISHLKNYLTKSQGQNIEVYVPRHDLASEWEADLDGINAKVIHVYPRTGGKWEEQAGKYEHDIKCQRADYVRDLEGKGHSIYGKACLSRTSGDRCSFFDECQYLDQFRPEADDSSAGGNTVRIYSHASLFLGRNEFERKITPDLVIIDEAFMSSAVSNMPSIPANEIIQHVRSDGKDGLGFDLVECLSLHKGDLSYLRNKSIESSDFHSVPLEHLNPSTSFDPEAIRSRDVRSAKLYRNLQLLIDHAVRELEDEEKESFEQLVFDSGNQKIIICEHRPSRVPRSAPVLYLDATADPIITEPYLPELKYHQIDVKQLAVISQVHDRTGSNTFWNDRLKEEKQNLAAAEYANSNNDLASLIVILNAWVKAGEKPLLVGHKALCDFLKAHPKLDQGVAVAHFMSLRGTNDYNDKSVIFITGRNQPPFDAIDHQARAIFGNSGNPLEHDDIEEMPMDQIEYWLSDRSPHKPSAIGLPTFSDPRIEAILRQVREAETVQAIARLRLVWASYPKRVFLLPNLPIEMPVDHLIEFNDLMPDRLEMELIKTGDLPLTALGLEKMRPDLAYAGASARQLFQPDRSKASDAKRLLYAFPTLVRTTAQIATFRAGNIRKTEHMHLFLPKNYSGDPNTALFTPWTMEQILAHLEGGWGDGEVDDLKLGFLYEGEPEVSG